MRKTLTILACTAAMLGWTGAAVANPDPHPTEHPKDDHKDGEHKDEHKEGHAH
ncbi:MAG: hypothetical protein RIS94_2643 [Pseudomonadota bacterium]|jgi:hypothetical protein